jgi:hypothetical protein
MKEGIRLCKPTGVVQNTELESVQDPTRANYRGAEPGFIAVTRPSPRTW